jgi:hypothetical protein
MIRFANAAFGLSPNSPAVISTTTPTVYVIQDDRRRNLLPAQAFGNVVTLLDARDEATFLNLQDTVFKLRRGLAQMRRGDFLVLIGNPISIGLACAIAAELTGELNLLKWDNQECRYWQAYIDLRTR